MRYILFEFKTLKLFLLAICLLLPVVTGCTPSELITVKQERDKTIEEIPILSEADYIQTFKSDWSNTEDGGQCYYARGYIVSATQLSIEEVRKAYSALLQEQGWINENQRNLGLFIRGQHERAYIAPVAQGTWISREVGLKQLKQQYNTVFSIRIDYMLPKRDHC